jgi:gamma-glutamyltranspeptidase/glutathione hydrolase
VQLSKTTGIRVLLGFGVLFVSSAAGAQTFPTAAIATDNILASEAGSRVLQAGGNAVDATVAAGLVLGVVNPFASGIGGGGFALVYDPGTDEVRALDFRETAPATTTADIFINPADSSSTRGGLAVAVPGEVAGWWTLHQNAGALAWADVVEPALSLARDGFPAGALLPSRLASAGDADTWPGTFAPYRGDDGSWVVEGETVHRPELANALQLISDQGAPGFYAGPVADDIVASVNDHGGSMTLDDLANYEPRWRTPHETEFQGVRIVQMPLPSSGAMVFEQTLHGLARISLFRVLPWSEGWTRRLILAWGFAFADRAQHLGDPDFVDLPTPGPWMLPERLSQIDEAMVMQGRVPGPDFFGVLSRPDVDDGTTHIAVVDSNGMAVSCTSTINTSFGSHLSTTTFGILLNNEMDDFVADPDRPNSFGLLGNAANAPAPGKRPLSSMSPTLVFDDEGLVGSIGASGGPQIITSTMQVMLALLAGDMHASDAVAHPRFHFQWMPFLVFTEVGAGVDASLGIPVQPSSMYSAVQVVWRSPNGGWQAGSDPRKHGEPSGY